MSAWNVPYCMLGGVFEGTTRTVDSCVLFQDSLCRPILSPVTKRYLDVFVASYHLSPAIASSEPTTVFLALPLGEGGDRRYSSFDTPCPELGRLAMARELDACTRLHKISHTLENSTTRQER